MTDSRVTNNSWATSIVGDDWPYVDTSHYVPPQKVRRPSEDVYQDRNAHDQVTSLPYFEGTWLPRIRPKITQQYIF